MRGEWHRKGLGGFPGCARNVLQVSRAQAKGPSRRAGISSISLPFAWPRVAALVGAFYQNINFVGVESKLKRNPTKMMVSSRFSFVWTGNGWEYRLLGKALAVPLPWRCNGCEMGGACCSCSAAHVTHLPCGGFRLTDQNPTEGGGQLLGASESFQVCTAAACASACTCTFETLMGVTEDRANQKYPLRRSGG